MDRTTEQHPSPEVLSSLALGQLDDSSFNEVEEHVANCSECAQVLARTQGDSFTALLQAAQSFSDTALPNTEASTLTTPMPTGKGDFTAVWEADAGPGSVELPAVLADHPRYRPIRPLGHGGMGSVWLVEHKLMSRTVAVKVIRPEILAKPGAGERFQREATNAARLHHHNIVTAFDFEQTGQSFLLAMEYVEGVSLADEVRKRGPLPVADACDYIRQTALGLQHAHEKGLVHRDLKPQNLMLTPDGTIKILDFGLAVLHDGGEYKDGLTGANMVVGTPDYIAPEQAEDSHKADFKSDVYSLGCTLYYLLTGHVPFPDDSLLRKLDAHRTQQPKPIRSLRPESPERLAAVVAKMMAKRPGDRYASAAAVAEALVACMRPATPPRSRRPLIAAALTLLAASLIAAAGVVFYIVTDNGTIEVRTDDDSVKIVAERNGKQITILDPKSKQTWIVDTGDYTLRLDGNADGLKIELPLSFTMKRGDKHVVTIKRVKGPDVAIKPVNLEKVGEVRRWKGHGVHHVARIVLAPDGTSAWTIAEDFRRWDLATGTAAERVVPPTWFDELLLSPNGKQFLAVDSWGGRTIRFYDVATMKQVHSFKRDSYRCWQAAWFPDGGRILTGDEHGVARIYDVASGDVLREFPGHVGRLTCVDISPDGKQILTVSDGDHKLRVWDPESRELLFALPEQIAGSHSALFVLEGKAILTGGSVRSIRLFDARTGKEMREFKTPDHKLARFALLKDGRHFVSAGSDTCLRLWNLESGRELYKASVGELAISLAVTPDGRYALIGTAKGEIIQWRLPAISLPDKDGWVPLFNGKDLAGWKLGPQQPGNWRVDDKGILIGSGPTDASHLFTERGDFQDFHLRVEAKINLLGNSGVYFRSPYALGGGYYPKAYEAQIFVGEAAHFKEEYRTGSLYGLKKFKEIIAPAGTWFTMEVIARGKRITIKVNNTTTVDEFEDDKYQRGHFALQQLGPETVVEFRKIEIKELPPPEKVGEIRKFMGHEGSVHGVAFSPCGEYVLSSSGWPFPDRTLRLWEVATGKELWSVDADKNETNCVAFAPNGQFVASGGTGGNFRLWRAESGKEMHALKHGRSVVSAVAFTTDSMRILTAGEDGWLRIWDVKTGMELKAFDARMGWVFGIAVTPDGGRAVTVGKHGTARLWDLEKGEEILSFEGHEGSVGAVACDPHRRYIATGGADRTARLWDVETGKEIHCFRGHTQQVTSVAFTPDGSRLLSGGLDKVLRLWDVETGKELHAFAGHADSIWSVACSPDGRYALSGGGGVVTDRGAQPGADWSLRLWRLPDPPPQQKVRPLHRIHFPGGRGFFLQELSQDGRLALACRRGLEDIRIWNVQTGHLVREVYGLVAHITPDGTQVITSHWLPSDFRVYDLATGKLVHRFGSKDQMYNFWLMERGTCLLNLTPTSLQVYDWSVGKLLWEIPWRDTAVHKSDRFLLTPDGKHLLVQTDGKPPLRVLDTATGKEVDAYRQLRDLPAPLGFSNAGKRLFRGDWDKFKVFDVASGKELPAPEEGRLDSGRLLIADAKTPGDFRLWDFDQERDLAKLHISDLRDPTKIHRFHVSRDGKSAVVTDLSDSVYLFRLPAPRADR